MLKVREATAAELGRYYNAVKIDFDSRELLPLSSVRRAVRRGDQEFLLFYDEETGMTEGYALCGIRNVYGYVLLKYFGIFSWYQGRGRGVEAMRLLHKRYARDGAAAWRPCGCSISAMRTGRESLRNSQCLTTARTESI